MNKTTDIRDLLKEGFIKGAFEALFKQTADDLVDEFKNIIIIEEKLSKYPYLKKLIKLVKSKRFYIDYLGYCEMPDYIEFIKWLNERC